MADRRIAAVEDHIDFPDLTGIVNRVDGRGLIAIPDLIDNHVHITGGGGEGGFATRTPELEIGDLVRAGVTGVIGVRGTDGFSRSMENLVAKAKAIRDRGFSCWILTGSYQVPVRTLTDRIESDIMLIREIIGVGEIAIADHRSSHPPVPELVSLVSAARIGGMLAGKSGVVNFHLGAGEAGFDILETALRPVTETPAKIFHLNGKGRIEAGYDADLVLLDTDLAIRRVMARGRFFDPEADG